jgi:hypothetical protein
MPTQPIILMSQATIKRYAYLLSCSVALISAISTTSLAQPTSPPDINQTESDRISTSPNGIELENAPIRIDALNLNIFLPKGSVTDSTSFGTSTTMGVGLPDQVGVMIIKELKTTDPDLTMKQVADNIVKQFTRFGNSVTGQLISRDPSLLIKTWTGERFYVKVPGLNGKPDSVRGMTIFQTEPQTFIIFDFTSLYRDFDRARSLYETSIGTMDLGNLTEDDVRRAAAIKAMLAFMDIRSIEDYQSALTGKKEEWQRLYLPASTGDEMDATEYGYRKIKSWGGFKGELSDKSKSSWNADDRKLGYFVQIDAMALEEGIRVDTRATFYMAEDTGEESWTIKMSLRRDGVQQTSTITGARSGKSMAIVMTDQSSAAPIKTHPLIQGDGYLSQVQTYLVGEMLAKNADPGEYASYAYNSSQGNISLRWDTVENPEGTKDLTKITTKVSNDTPPTVSSYDRNGDLIRVRLANGRIWEPITLDRLIKLWRKKGLPLD